MVIYHDKMYFSNIPNTEYYPDPKLQYANNFPRQMKTLQERDENETCSFRAYICSKNERLEIPILYFSTTFFQSYGNYPFSIG